jgi:hypothetical protein
MDDKKICEHCGTILSQYERFCPECGSEYKKPEKSKGDTYQPQPQSGPQSGYLSHQENGKSLKWFSGIVFPLTKKKVLVSGIIFVIALSLVSAAIYAPLNTKSTATNSTTRATNKTGVVGNITAPSTRTLLPTPLPTPIRISQPTPMPTPLPTPFPTPMPTPLPTPEPTPYPTIFPTPTPVPTPTPIPPGLIK